MKKIISAFVFIVAFVPSIFSQSNEEWYDCYDFSSVVPSGQTLYFKSEVGYSTPHASIILPCWKQFGQYGQGRTYGYGDYEKPSGSLFIPEEVTHDGVTYKVSGIDDDAFAQCQITSVTINIEFDYCFRYLSTLETVILGDSIFELWSGLNGGCFEGCDNLSSITLGKSVQKIRSAFKGLTHLTTIISKAEFPPQCASDCFEGVPAYADIIVPCGAAYRYELADYWKDFTRITEDCSAIGDVDGLQDIHVSVFDGSIVVEGVNNMEIYLFDIMGRLVGSTKDNRINVPTNGTYMLKIGNLPARKVVVVR